MSTYRDVCIRDLQENGSEVFLIEEDGKRVIYEIKKTHRYENSFYYISTIFHVWDGDCLIYCTRSYQKAIEIFKEGENS